MLIFDSESQPIIINSLSGPMVSSHMWVLDLNLLDFTLAPILMLEEVVCPSVEVLINGFQFILPASWFVMVYDKETAQLDVVALADAAGKQFTALMYGPKMSAIAPATITVTNYFSEHKNTGPGLNKQQMLCHPVGPNEWIVISPSDCYNKYLKDIIVGDLIGH
jgi:hypothetical protein